MLSNRPHSAKQTMQIQGAYGIYLSDLELFQSDNLRRLCLLIYRNVAFSIVRAAYVLFRYRIAINDAHEVDVTDTHER